MNKRLFTAALEVGDPAASINTRRTRSFGVAVLISALVGVMLTGVGRIASAQSSGWVLDHYEQTATESNASGAGPTLSTTSSSPFVDSYGGTGAVVNATITPVFRWTGTATQSVTPLSVLLTATAQVGINGAPSTSFAGNASDGLNDSAANAYVSASWFPGGQYLSAITSSGKHLIQVGVPATLPTNTFVSLPPVSLSAQSTGGTNGGLVGVTLTAAYDNRMVTITDPTNGKFPAYNSNGTLSYDADGDENFVPQAHTIVNDVMYGDTIFSYNDTTLSETFPYWQTLLAGYSGTWHTISGEDYQGNSENVPNVDWAWSPAGSATAPDTWDHHDMFEPYATNFHLENGSPVGSDPSQAVTIGYEAVDKIDGATAVASYVMVLHDLYERNYPDHVVAGIENVRPAPNAEYVRNNQSTSEPLTVYMEQSDSWSLGFAGDGAVAAWIAAEESINVSASYTFSVNSGVQATVNDVQPGWAIYLQEFDAYNYHANKVDIWNEQGYVGTAIHHFKVPQNPCGGIQASTPVYEPVGNPGS